MSLFNVLLIVFIASFPLMLVTMSLHTKYYRKALLMLSNRGIDVHDLKPEFFDYGSRGCITKIKKLYSIVGKDNLEIEELNLLRLSKSIYYWSGSIYILIFVAMVLSGFAEKADSR